MAPLRPIIDHSPERKEFRRWIGSALAAATLVTASVYGVAVVLGMEGGKEWPVGYYGEFNRVKWALASLPGVEVGTAWVNEDVILEEFCLEATRPDGRVVRLEFSETDRVRRLRGNSLRSELATRLERGTTHRAW